MTKVDDSAGRANGMVTGGVLLLLRLEDFALMAAAVVGYAWNGGSWWLFAILLLAPDLSFAGYLAGPRIGALAYNALHTTIGPLALLVLGLLTAQPLLISMALIWATHVGMDRALGYGLKYESAFSQTHLGRIGRR